MLWWATVHVFSHLKRNYTNSNIWPVWAADSNIKIHPKVNPLTVWKNRIHSPPGVIFCQAWFRQGAKGLHVSLIRLGESFGCVFRYEPWLPVNFFTSSVQHMVVEMSAITSLSSTTVLEYVVWKLDNVNNV